MSADAFGNQPAMTETEMVEAGLLDDVGNTTPKGEIFLKRLDEEGLGKYVLELALDDEAFAQQVQDKIQMWALRGDGVAIYRNMDMGHSSQGLLQMASFGSPIAQIETDEEHLPTTLPDFPGQINWRYQLVGWYR